MKYVKTLGLLAVAAVALLAFAGTASATTVTSPEGTAYTSTIKASSTNSSIDGSFITVSCNSSTMEGQIETHGSSTTAKVKLSGGSFSGCNYAITVKKWGELLIHPSGFFSKQGTVTSSGGEFIIHTSSGECVFGTEATDIGTLTNGTPGIIHVELAKLLRIGGSFLCGSSATWTGNYTVTTPSSIAVD